MSIPWVIAIILSLIVGQSYVLNKWGLQRILYKRSFQPDPVFTGDEIEMVDELTNQKLLPLPWLRLESKLHPNLSFSTNDLQIEIHGETFYRSLFSLLPYQKVTRRQKIVCKKRGYYRFETVSMSTGDIFGYSESFQHYQALVELTVYPKIIPIDALNLPSHSWMGDILIRRWIMEDPFVLSGVREYVSGDPMNTINWKATARTNGFQVNQKGHTADHQLLIYVNFDQTEDIWLPIADEDLVETGLSYAASIANFALLKGVRTGFGCNSYFVEPFGKYERNQPSVRTESYSGEGQLSYLLDVMAKLKMDRSMNFERFLQEDMDRNLTNADILIITSIITEKMQQKIKALQANGNAVDIIRIDADRNEQDECRYKVGDDHAV